MTSIRHLLLVDENLPEMLVTKYIEPHLSVSNDGVRAVHFRTKFGPNGRWKDQDFVPKIAEDRRWVVLSADRGQKSKTFDALPLLCLNHHVTLIHVSSNVVGMGLSYYGAQIIGNWLPLVQAFKALKGSQFSLKNRSKRQSATLVLSECPHGYQKENHECVKKAKKAKKRK